MRPVFYIPKGTELVVVADMFAENFTGGAELTLEAILEACPVRYFKVRSAAVTPEIVEAGKDIPWLLGNIAQLNKTALIEIARTARFSRIECDYLYCGFRSSHLHKLQTGLDCDCHIQEQGRFVQGLYKRAQQVHFMSVGQREEYFRLFPKMRDWPAEKLRVQGSTFTEERLGFIEGLYQKRQEIASSSAVGAFPAMAVLGGGSWIKNQEETEAYCKKHGFPYKVIGGLPPEDFLKELATCAGLIFHPKGFDTNPRVTIEAKLLGLALDLNENVQQQHEPWFAGSREDTMNHQQGLAAKFWQKEEQLLL